MKKTTTLMTLLLFLVFIHQYQAQQKCLEYIRGTDEVLSLEPITQYGIDITWRNCPLPEYYPYDLEYNMLSKLNYQDCCKKMRQRNYTCICSPDSGLLLPKHILYTSATQTCNAISIPQIGHCRGYCGWNETDLKDMVPKCTPYHFKGRRGPLVSRRGCCTKLSALDFNCLCSPVARVVIPKILLTAADSYCDISYPKIGQCRLPNAAPQKLCETVIKRDLDELEETCSPSRNDLTDCCRGLSAYDLPCLCSRTDLLMTHNILTGASRCNITFPQQGQCLQVCGGFTKSQLQRNIQELESSCNPVPFKVDCCPKLGAFNFTCPCSTPTTKGGVDISGRLLSAAEICNTPIPQTGQCRRPEKKCKVVQPYDIQQLEQLCKYASNVNGLPSNRKEAKIICCRRVTELFINSTCRCSNSTSDMDIPFSIRGAASTKLCKKFKAAHRVPKLIKRCPGVEVVPVLPPDLEVDVSIVELPIVKLPDDVEHPILDDIVDLVEDIHVPSVARNITTDADLCGLSPPQIGQCRQGNCGWNATHLLDMGPKCQTYHLFGVHNVHRDCCPKLRALNFTCMCSPLARVFIPTDLLAAASICKIFVPQTGQCAPKGN